MIDVNKIYNIFVVIDHFVVFEKYRNFFGGVKEVRIKFAFKKI